MGSEQVTSTYTWSSRRRERRPEQAVRQKRLGAVVTAPRRQRRQSQKQVTTGEHECEANAVAEQNIIEALKDPLDVEKVETDFAQVLGHAMLNRAVSRAGR
mmetsp:Transcript_141694/g.453095  ORF Transcript_141694/g.453095 Transcript_141694/m.453095 type:complete len:101 (+) Transcript_141694:771-1073(+)